MTTYGYKTYKARHWVVELRDADNCSMGDIVTFGQGRQSAFRHFASKHKGWKIARLWEVDPTDTDSMERYGFIPSPTRPASVRWSNLDLY
jgi:hypothetical protein